MGITKHGKDSARSKKYAKYKSEGRYERNKKNIAEKILNRKKVKSHKAPKTSDMKWNVLIRNTKMSHPYCSSDGVVLWGVDKDTDKVKNKKF